MAEFSVSGTGIIDNETGDPVSPAQFNELASPAQKSQIERDLISRGLMTNQRGEMGANELDEADRQLDEGFADEPTPRTVSASAPAGTPTDATPSTDTPSLQEFIKLAKPANPNVPVRALSRYWNEHYGHVDPKTLPSLETFLPAAKEKNPTRPEHELKSYWEDHYGALGAQEKNPPSPGITGTAKDLGLKAASGVVDVAQSVVGLASLASGGKAGDILRGWGWDPDAANKFLNSKTSEAQQTADKAVHDAKGFIDTAIAYAKNPRAIAGGVAEAAPGMGVMYGAAARAATIIAEKAAAAFGGLTTTAGAAAAKAAIEASGSKLMWVSSGAEGALSAGQIADQAQGAGREYSDYLLPSVGGGAGTALIGRGAGKLMGGSSEVALATGSKAGAFEGNWATRTAKSIFSEGFLEEMPQSAQEQVFQNLALGNPWREGVPEAAAAGLVIGGAMGGAMGGVQRPTPPPPAPPEPPEPPEQQAHGPYNTPQGPQQPQPLGPKQPEPLGPFQPQPQGPQLPKALGPTLPESLGPQLQKALGPSNEPQGPYRPTVRDVIGAGSIDEAIATADGLLNAADVPFLQPTEKRAGVEIPVLPMVEPVAPPLIQPGQVFTPRVTPDVDPRAAIAAERARIVAMQQARKTSAALEPESPAPVQPAPSDAPLPTQLDHSFPTVQKVQAQAEAQGVNADVLNAMGRQMTGKASLDDLSPAELQKLATRLDEIKPTEIHQPKPDMPSQPEPLESGNALAAPPSPEGLAPQPSPGTAPIAAPGEAPLFSKAAQEPDVEQGRLALGQAASYFDLPYMTDEEAQKDRERVDRIIREQDRRMNIERGKLGLAPLDEAAHEAATSPNNERPEPTQAQKKAGNYAKGHLTISGMDISIENPEGSTRSGTDANGKPWSVTMQSHYGYLKGTVGKDKDHLDVFIKPGTPEDYSGPVFVIDQMKPGTKTLDEHKIVLGASSSAEAREIYQSNYAKDWKGLGSLSTFTMEQFKSWLEKGDHTKPAVNYKPSIQAEKDKLEAQRPSKATLIPTRRPDGSIEWVAKPQEPESVDTKVKASLDVSRYVAEQLRGQNAFTVQDLYSQADKAFGGTQAEGAYTPKDAFDAIELGVNQYILDGLYQTLPDDPMGSLTKSRVAVDQIRKQILDKIPAQQNRRTAEQDEFQQFSTPPDLAFVMAMVAHIAPNDVVLEPSAGLGGLAVFAEKAGATVHVNEYAERRVGLLRNMGFDHVTRENAEQLNNILPDSVKPTVVLMNPPFSSTAGRIPGERKSSNSIAHLEQALKRLAPGGRLVALIGKGREAMGGETSRAVEAWIAAPGKTLLARIGVSGKGYKKYGTDYDNQILVFDKMESAGQSPVIANVEDIRDAIPLLKEVRDARVHSSAQPTADQSGSKATPRPSEGANRPGQPVSPATDSLGARPAEGVRPDRSTGTTASSGGRGAQSRPASTAAGSDVSNRDARPGGRGEQSQLGEPVGQGTEGRGLESDRRPGPSTQDGERRVPAEGNASTRAAEEAVGTDLDPSDVGDLTDAVYETYRPKKLKIQGAKPHPGELVESAAMNAVDAPDVTYQPDLPQGLITDGSVSIAQMEAVVAAGQAHEKILPSGVRQGFFVGDGTGVGKGREISAIILDNFRHGRQKALWVSMKPDLITDAKRDWSGIHQDPDQIFGTTSAKTPISNASGILFATYAGLYQGTEADRGGALSSRLDKKGDGTTRVASRLDQIVAWLGHDFDGVIAFDEAHAMGNASPDSNDGGQRGGAKEASLTGLVGLELQKRLPLARVVYVSATGATEVANLAYAERLGLWGTGTAFADRNTFIGKMKEGGLAAMELVAQNLKAMGLYLARQLSFRGVTYDKLEHQLTDKQRVMYDEIARAWQLVFRNMDAALKLTGGNENARTKGAARGRFWSTQLGFYNQLLTSMLMPSVLADVQRQVDQGHAVVLQLVNTNEALAKRTRADAKQEGLDMDALDLTPKRMLLEYVDKAFPTQQFEQVMDADGKVTSQPVVDSQGRPVESAEAVAMKDALLRKLADLNVPEGALEQLLDTFGEKMVAEVTGRQTRDIRVTDAEGNITKVSQTGRSHKMRQTDAKAFMDDKKQILVFSAAGGTGMSYHADLSAKNQRKRIHYLIQPGWRADGAVQGFGRTHRSNQKQPPHYILATTDLKGHKRFISSVARRLNQLGALTKGQRQTGGQGFFSEEDNLEGPYAAGAMRALFMDLFRGRVEGMGWADLVEQRMGLDNLVDKRTGTLLDEKIPKLTQFMNRILSLEVNEQNQMFDAFHDRMRRAIELAASKGELDTGMENLDAAGVTLSKEETVYIHPESQSKTKLLDFEVTHNISFVPFEEAQKLRNLVGFVVGKKSGKVFAEVRPGTTSTDKAGEVHTDIILRSTVHGRTTYTSKEKVEKNYEPVDTAIARAKWQDQIKAIDPTYTEIVHLLSGTMLPIWDRLPEGFMRVMRVQEDNGRRWIGRIIEGKDLAPMKKRLGVEAEGEVFTPQSAIAALNAKSMGSYIVLSNDWKIYRRRVNQEMRYELTGKELSASWPELSKAGVFSERINYQPRYFIPSGRAADVLENLTQYRKIVDVVGEKDKEPTETQGATDDEEGISSAQVEQAEPAPTFYSHALKVLEAKMPNRASFEQVKSTLSNNGVKPDEIKWLGLDDYLKQKDYHTKEDVLAFVRANQVQVNETVMGESKELQWQENPQHDGWSADDASGASWEVIADGKDGWELFRNGNTAEYEPFSSAEKAKAFASEYADVSPTRFSGHLPIKGGTNYREIVMTLPGEEKTIPSYDEWVNLKLINDDFSELFDSPAPIVDTSRERYEREKRPLPKPGAHLRTYSSSHWPGISNPIAHLRVADFTDTGGQKVLVVLENQSDWHQAGKKTGYRSKDAIQGTFVRKGVLRDGMPTDFYQIYLVSANDPEGELWDNAKYSLRGALDQIERLNNPESRDNPRMVPDAPFKKNWHELVMRRALRMAAEGGYDKIGWVTGQQTADLYDLSKQISRVDYHPGKKRLAAFGHTAGERPVILEESVTEEKLADFIGKEAAQKIVDKEPSAEGWKQISGLDLKVGGEWAMNLYDAMIPQYMSKLGKKWGATVGASAVSTADAKLRSLSVEKAGSGERPYRLIDQTGTQFGDYMYATREEAEAEKSRLEPGLVSIHALPITDAMRDSVLTDGQALFQRQANLDPMPEEAQAVQAGIEGKTPLQAAQFLSAHAPNQAYREIAQRVAEQIQHLQKSGMKFELKVYHLGDMAPGSLAGSRALNSRKFGSNVSTLSFNGADVTGKVGTSYQTVLHELIHAVTQTAVYVGTRHISAGTPIGKLGDDLIALNNAVVQHFNQRIDEKADLTTFEKKVHAGLNNALANPDELLAWGLTNPEMQAFMESIPYKTSTMWNAFVDTIRRFLGLSAKANTALSEILRIGDALLSAPAQSYAGMASEARLPITSSQQDEARAQTDEGISAAQTDTGMIDKLEAGSRLAAATTSARPYLLGSLGLHQLATVYGKDHKEVANYNRASQQMETDFVEITRESDEILKHWDALKVNVADRMARVMEQARFANYDPDISKHQEAKTAKERALFEAFDKLPDEAKAVYREARDFYAKLANRRFEAIAARIDRAGGTPENRKAALDKLRLAYDQVRAKVYFPFTRFGDHIVIARQMVNGVEKDREVSSFESPLEAQQFATLMKARGWKVKQTMAKEYSRDSEGAASKAVREILNVVNGIDETTDSKHQLLDAINQTFINSLPDMSYAKHFTHAKDVKGFSKDALRAFAHSAMHGAHHISRIQNADHLTRALATMDERINQADEGDVTEARQVHNELTKRHNQILDPNASPVAAWLGQLGFTMSLGGVVATGITNATQVPLVTFPWLWSRYGFGKAGAALGRAYKDFLDPATLNSDSLFDASQSQRLSPAERAMLKELQRRGRIDLTQTMDLSGRASQDNLSRVAKSHGSIQDRIAKMLGFTFHAPEVMNRQVTALATYRMEMTRNEDGETAQQKQERAINQAETAIIDTHFIYTQENRPRYMSGNVMRVLTMFKQYSQNIAFLYGRSAQLWLSKNAGTKEERAIAKRQIASMAALQFAAAGALGMPFIGSLASIFTAIMNGFGDDDDKKDWEVELRKMLADQFGKEAGEVLSHGVSRLTPWDMAARLGQSDLFFRAPQREREGRTAAMDWVTSLSGPVLGYAVNAYLGVGDITKGIKSADSGHFLRGVEEMTPAVIRNGVKALRYEMEHGIKTRDGHTQLDLDGAEKFGQFFGFAPSRGAEMYESTNAIKNLERHVAEARANLLDDYARAYENRDEDGKQAVIADVRAFNLKHRELAINGDTLMRSLKGRMRREQGTVGGVYLPKKREGLRREGAFANF